jgi:hypothetical protein
VPSPHTPIETTALQLITPYEAINHTTMSMQVSYLPASRCLAVRWPLTGTLSIVSAVLRVYPALKRALAALPPAHAPKQASCHAEALWPPCFDLIQKHVAWKVVE